MLRRDVLKTILLGGLALACPPLWAGLAEAAEVSGRIAILGKHFEEYLDIRYMKEGGGFDGPALARLNRLFRCTHTGKVHSIEPRLFILLDMIQGRLGARARHYELACGYRSPAYNVLCCAQDGKAARNSFHTKGMAADLVLEGVPVSKLRRTAADLHMGGVGRYRSFVHIDVGPPRTW